MFRVVLVRIYTLSKAFADYVLVCAVIHSLGRTEDHARVLVILWKLNKSSIFPLSIWY